MNKIKLDDAGHVYLNEYDISPFVVHNSIIISGETIALTVIGDIDDQREKKSVKKAVKRGNRKNTHKA